MAASNLPSVGDRVRTTGYQPNDPAPLPVGSEGTVTAIHTFSDGRWTQISVAWDNGRGLMLLNDDPFIVL